VSRFASCVAIDWSGAKGKRHKGIAIAEARGGDAPRLVRPGHVWSRAEVLGWLLRRAAKEPTLFGFDFSFAPPFVGRGAYLPGETGVPECAREFWAYVDALSHDEDLGAASFLEEVHRRHFYFGVADGVKADFMHLRACVERDPVALKLAVEEDSAAGRAWQTSRRNRIASMIAQRLGTDERSGRR